MFSGNLAKKKFLRLGYEFRWSIKIAILKIKLVQPPKQIYSRHDYIKNKSARDWNDRLNKHNTRFSMVKNIHFGWRWLMPILSFFWPFPHIIWMQVSFIVGADALAFVSHFQCVGIPHRNLVLFLWSHRPIRATRPFQEQVQDLAFVRSSVHCFIFFYCYFYFWRPLHLFLFSQP